MPRTIFINRRLSSALLLAAVPLLSLAESPFLRAGAGGGAERSADASHPVLELGPRMVTVSPGSNAVLEVAIDHLNRIVTPFSRPSVRNTGGASRSIDATTCRLRAGSGSGAIAALALWPLSQLPAGAETGLLLALHQAGEGQGVGDTAARKASATMR